MSRCALQLRSTWQACGKALGLDAPPPPHPPTPPPHRLLQIGFCKVRLTSPPHAQAGEQAGFPHLLALHAFAVTDVDLCMPPSDAGKFVRSLAPYLKVAPGGGCWGWGAGGVEGCLT
jgi:hypothetical protein